ncbi:bifunctional adenosylcobinamide kinase/adenosylcobinamide-phosphate guanylyltransferase [Leuconostoc citreum]|uniref:bifunctional adenosylcobinamide kinase/adenosylcobinamide-phosphate guanylyltransferase n=1 Tax=Leuconostoc citreum TaxID=33964 RepID=UPI00200B6791|nr:bifunctional adenosylcobinamide kinase/adenosylcobinamide-phosphate guanylyltransferase [Leuconostoc citreum]MCK8605672.1 bifunctional adenosylcobinamide kinase/adenosylcobinamide-phosphate guanylyltransferase [Leuconostoc citreum]
MRESISNAKRSAMKAKGNNVDLIEEVQNPSGLVFHTNYFDDGMSATAIINVYDYPKTPQPAGWFKELINQKNTITQLKIGTNDKQEVQDSLQKATLALNSKANSEYTAQGDALEAAADFQINMSDLNQARNGREIYKRLYVRLMVSDVSPEALRKRVKEIQQSLSAYRMKVYPAEQATHFKQFFVPASEIENQVIKDKGFPMKALALAGTYAFNQTFIAHPRGTYLGLTTQRGEVMYDPSYNDSHTQLTAYNLIVGGERSGKSAFAKKNLPGLIARGDTAWVFDKSDEWRDLVDYYFGVTLTLDGSQNIINILQVFGTVLNAEGQVDVIGSFNQHRSKINTYYATLNPQADQKELEMLGNLVTDFYIEKRMWSPSPRDNPQDLRVIGLRNEDYPILEDFETFLETRNMMTRNMTQPAVERLDNILSTIRSLIENHGDMVNGITTMPDLSHERLVRFDTSGLSRLKSDLYNAQYFTILSLMESYITINGTKQRQRIKTGEINTKSSDRQKVYPKYFWWVQDEADDIFNAKHALGISFGDNLMAQHGKDFFGMMAIFPGLKNVVPTGQFQDSDASRAASSFFGRFPKQIIGRLSTADTKRLRAVVSETNITNGQLSALQNIGQGDFLMNLIGKQATFMHVDLSQEEIDLFGGGL